MYINVEFTEKLFIKEFCKCVYKTPWLYITQIKDKNNLVMAYLNDIYNTIVKKDIIERNSIKDISLLENIVKYVCANIGSSISANKISDYLNSNKIVEKSNHLTIDNYLKMLENAFIIYKADRSDIRSKALLKL